VVQLPEVPFFEQFSHKRTSESADEHSTHQTDKYSTETGYTRTDDNSYDAAEDYSNKSSNDNTGFPGRAMRSPSGWTVAALFKQHFGVGRLLVLERITPPVGGNGIDAVFLTN